MLLTKEFVFFLFLVLVLGFSLSNKCIKSCQSTFSHSIFQAVTVRPLSSAWTEWSILNSRRASPKIPETWPEFFGFSHLWPEKPEILLSETRSRPEFSGWGFFSGFLGSRTMLHTLPTVRKVWKFSWIAEEQARMLRKTRETDVDKCTYSEMVVNLGNPKEYVILLGFRQIFLHFIRSLGSGSIVY